MLIPIMYIYRTLLLFLSLIDMALSFGEIECISSRLKEWEMGASEAENMTFTIKMEIQLPNLTLHPRLAKSIL